MKNDSQWFTGITTVKHLPVPTKKELLLRLRPIVEKTAEDYGNGTIPLCDMVDRITEAAASAVSLPSALYRDLPSSFSVKSAGDGTGTPDEAESSRINLFWNGVCQGPCDGLNPEKGFTDEDGNPVDYSFLTIRNDIHVFTLSDITPEDIDCEDHYVLDTDNDWLDYMAECHDLAEENFFKQYIQLMELRADMTDHLERCLINLIRANKRVLRKTGYWPGLKELAGRF